MKFKKKNSNCASCLVMLIDQFEEGAADSIFFFALLLYYAIIILQMHLDVFKCEILVL